jgi:hypothetical protein
LIVCKVADHGGLAVEVGISLPPLKHSGSWLRFPLEDVCVRLFCVCVILCVGSGLAMWLIPHPRSPTVEKIKKLKSGQGPTNGCTAIDR